MYLVFKADQSIGVFKSLDKLAAAFRLIYNVGPREFARAVKAGVLRQGRTSLTITRISANTFIDLPCEIRPDTVYPDIKVNMDVLFEQLISHKLVPLHKVKERTYKFTWRTEPLLCTHECWIIGEDYVICYDCATQIQCKSTELTYEGVVAAYEAAPPYGPRNPTLDSQGRTFPTFGSLVLEHKIGPPEISEALYNDLQQSHTRVTERKATLDRLQEKISPTESKQLPKFGRSSEFKRAIADLGPMGIVIWDGDVIESSVRYSLLDALWDLPVDIEHWQKEPHPPKLETYVVSSRNILLTILRRLDETKPHISMIPHFGPPIEIPIPV